MTKVISVVNQKGGVAKTTTAVNVSAILALDYKKKVLIIDFDSQGNASISLGIKNNIINKKNIYRLLINEITPLDSIVKTDYKNLDIIPSDMNLAGLESELSNIDNKQYILKNAIETIKNNYDYVFIDCPPSLSIMTVNALVASDLILIPLQPEFFALQGVAHLLDTAGNIQRNFNSNLKINGVILTMYSKSAKATLEVEKDVRNWGGDMIYKTVIPRNIRISEAPSHNQPIIVYDPICPGSVAYRNFTKEFLNKI